MSVLVFFAKGRPAPQGSKIPVRVGAFTQLREASRHVEPWRHAVAAHAREALGHADDFPWPLTGPATVKLTVCIEQAHSNRTPHPIARLHGDIDKHARSILDALVTALVIADDSLVVVLTAQKKWVEPGMGGAWISVEPHETALTLERTAS